jgi:hypothetical protein
MAELEVGVAEIRKSPLEQGLLAMIVRRPEIGGREVLEQGELDLVEGLVGDNWLKRMNPRSPDGLPDPGTQLNIMNSRAIEVIARDKERWKLAGDQLFIDLDLSEENVPPGTRIAIGAAIIEVTSVPHTGCRKFMERFGEDAMKFVNSPWGKKLHLRGISARVVKPGKIRLGDIVRKLKD